MFFAEVSDHEPIDYISKNGLLNDTMTEAFDSNELDDFVASISAEYQDKLKDSIHQKELEEKAKVALEAAHYEPLTEGAERYTRQWDEIEAGLRERYASEASDEDFESYVAYECAAQLYAMSVSEYTYITMIEILYFAVHQADETNLDPTTIRQAKMEIMADMVIEGQILVNSPLMAFANDFAPGGLVVFDDSEMQPYLVKSLEKTEQRRAAAQRSNTIVKIAYKIARVESRHDEEAERIQDAIQNMLLASDDEGGVARDAANRQEKLYRITREASIDPVIAQKLVAYFEEMFPL